MAGNITDFAICIDKNIAIATLPTGTVRVGASGEPAKIVIGKATTMTTPFCNGIDAGVAGILPFIALPASPNFSGQFVIIGRVGEPTYWGFTDTAALIEQCTVLNGGDGTGFSDPGQEIANCKIFLDNNGYALSNSAASFLAGYFP
jgi:hypothetical protein